MIEAMPSLFLSETGIVIVSPGYALQEPTSITGLFSYAGSSAPQAGADAVIKMMPRCRQDCFRSGNHVLSAFVTKILSAAAFADPIRDIACIQAIRRFCGDCTQLMV